MINTIPIKITERGEVKKEITILAMENENDSKTLEISLPLVLVDKWIYLDFETPNGVKSQTGQLTPIVKGAECFVSYDIKGILTQIAGTLKMQVLAKDSSGLVWKSYVTSFTLKTSINATEEIAKANPDVLADLQGQIDELKEGGVGGVTSYNDLTDKPVIPSKMSDLTNDSGYITGESDPTVPDYVKNIKQADIDKWNSGGDVAVPIEEISGANVTLEPNKHYIIKGVLNSLKISLSEPITTELKHYSFEFSTVDRIPTITINGVELPYKYEFAKHTKYVCEIVNNNLVIKGTYDGYAYKFVYGLYSSSDYLVTYNLKDDRTVTKVANSVTTNGTYQVEESGSAYLVTITYEDSNLEILTYNESTLTNGSDVYTKI